MKQTATKKDQGKKILELLRELPPEEQNNLLAEILKVILGDRATAYQETKTKQEKAGTDLKQFLDLSQFIEASMKAMNEKMKG